MVSAIAPVAVSSQGWVLVVVVVVILAGLVYGFYTRSGSGISEHPLGVSDEAPGAEGRSEVSGKDEGEGSTFDTHGTR
jgi:hypothetical protein